MIEVDRLVLGLGCLGDELVGRLFIQRETLLDDVVELVALALRDFAIDRRGVNQQGGGRHTVIIIGKLARLLLSRAYIRMERMEQLKHGHVKDPSTRISSP